MDAMRSCINEGMRDGAWGLSTGLTYPPGRWTPTQEIIGLARVAAKYEGIYVTHLRDYGDGLGDAIEEALEIGRRASIPVHFSHFHVSGPGRDGRAGEYLAPIEAARQLGQRATLDLYPYEAGCTTLAAFLPKWLQAHPTSDVLTMLQDSGSRARVIQDLTIRGPGKTSAVGWEHFVIGGTVGETLENLRGKHLIDVARAQGVTPEELVCDLLVRTRAQVCALVFQGYEANVRRVLHDEWATQTARREGACLLLIVLHEPSWVVVQDVLLLISAHIL
jgi:N-acyl-D-amino-acid deacylase